MAKHNVSRGEIMEMPVDPLEPTRSSYIILTRFIYLDLPKYFWIYHPCIVEEIRKHIPSLDNYTCTHFHFNFVLKQVSPFVLRDIADEINKTFPKYMRDGHFIAAFAYPGERLVKISMGKGRLSKDYRLEL